MNLKAQRHLYRLFNRGFVIIINCGEVDTPVTEFVESHPDGYVVHSGRLRAMPLSLVDPAKHHVQIFRNAPKEQVKFDELFRNGD